jgi:hypothetical protein
MCYFIQFIRKYDKSVIQPADAKPILSLRRRQAMRSMFPRQLKAGSGVPGQQLQNDVAPTKNWIILGKETDGRNRPWPRS